MAQQRHDGDARARLVEAALPHVETQLRLVRGRIDELRKLESELDDRRALLLRRRRELKS